MQNRGAGLNTVLAPHTLAQYSFNTLLNLCTCLLAAIGDQSAAFINKR